MGRDPIGRIAVGRIAEVDVYTGGHHGREVCNDL